MTVFRFVEREKAGFPARTLCRVLGVSPSGCCAWSGRGPSARSVIDTALTGQIRRAHARGRGTYGAPRVHAELREAGVHIGRKRIARLMRADGLADDRSTSPLPNQSLVPPMTVLSSQRASTGCTKPK